MALKVSPPAVEEEYHTIQFNWVGDARGVLLRRDSSGKWYWIYRTVDEGIPSKPDVLRPLVDFDPGGGRRTLMMGLHPLSNVVTNSLGIDETLRVRATESGEIPNPADRVGTGSAPASRMKNGIQLRRGDLALLGSDGFWENFGSTREILDLIEGCSTTEEVVTTLRTEAHRRMEILARAKEWIEEEASAGAGGDLAAADILAEGIRYQFEYNGKSLWIDLHGAVYETAAEGTAVNHFKNDNFSLIAYLHNPKNGRTTLPFPAGHPAR